ncbi:MAG: hypothetical protein V1681_01160 [Candidatus Neomarinimicrobiota bacterium]
MSLPLKDDSSTTIVSRWTMNDFLEVESDEDIFSQTMEGSTYGAEIDKFG